MSIEWFQAVGWQDDPYCCTCWDIPRSDCCYCGANERIEERARQQAKSFRITQHSYDMATWAFGTGVFA